jgi:adenosylhomocysteine nucleosidase
VAVVLMPVERVLSHPCVIFALRRESMGFRRVWRCRERVPDAPCRAHLRGADGQTALLLECGIGTAAMEAALHWCLGRPRYRPRFVVSAGFSGALQPGLRVGDLILATELTDLQDRILPAHCPEAFLAHRECRPGRLLTVPEMVGDPAEKQRLGQCYQALAVDMESAVAARLCREQGIPFACLRVISDDVNTALSPHLVGLLRGGRVSAARLLRTVMCHPAVIGELLRLGRQTRRAAQRLRAVGSLLSTWNG